MARKRNPRDMPEPIDDTPENIAAAILTRSPKDDWAYLEGHTADRDDTSEQVG